MGRKVNREYTLTRRFEKDLARLQKNEATQTEKALDLYFQNPLHPSLHFKKIQGTGNLFEIRINLSLRIVVEIIREEKVETHNFLTMGSHDKVF